MLTSRRRYLLPIIGLLVVHDVASGTENLRPWQESPPGQGPAVRWQTGDRLPAAMALVPDAAAGRTYGIVIVDGRTVLVVDRATRQVVEVLE